jgi:hypothetical protein
MEVDGRFHAVAALLPGKDTRYSLERGIQWPQNDLAPVEKLSLSNPGNNPHFPVVLPRLRHYTRLTTAVSDPVHCLKRDLH